MAKYFQTSAILFLALFAAVIVAEDYDVGDDSDWMRPSNPNFYTTWAAGKTFRVGDVLEFEFPANVHDVAVVNKAGYDGCIKTNPIMRYTTSPVNYRLNTTGPHYFICTVGDHCTAGQKLTVDVVGSTGRGGGATPAAPPTPSGTPAPTTPSGTTTPSGNTNNTTSETPPPSAAASLGGASFLVVLMSIAAALLY